MSCPLLRAKADPESDFFKYGASGFREAIELTASFPGGTDNSRDIARQHETARELSNGNHQALTIRRCGPRFEIQRRID